MKSRVVIYLRHNCNPLLGEWIDSSSQTCEEIMKGMATRLSSEHKLPNEQQNTIQKTRTTQNDMNQEPWWKQKNL